MPVHLSFRWDLIYAVHFFFEKEKKNVDHINIKKNSNLIEGSFWSLIWVFFKAKIKMWNDTAKKERMKKKGPILMMFENENMIYMI